MSKILILGSKGTFRLESYGENVNLLEISGSPGFWTLDTIKDALKYVNLNDISVIVVPGNFQGDLTELSEEIGIPIVKGPLSPMLLPRVLSILDPSTLSPKEPFEKVMPSLASMIHKEVLEEVLRRPPKGEAFRIGNLKVPRRPPPQVILSEVYVCNREDEEREILRRVKEGADVIILGRSFFCKEERYVRVVKKFIEELKVPIGVDPGNYKLLIKLLEEGAEVGLSLTPDLLKKIPKKLRKEKAFVLIPNGKNAIEELLRSEKVAERLRFEKLILDPLVFPPVYPGTLEGFFKLKELSKRSKNPLLFGLCNVIEMIDGDSTGATLLALSLAAEAGASLILTVEESPKTFWNTLEAKIASFMVSLSRVLMVPPKDLIPFSLLLLKPKVFNYVRFADNNVKVHLTDRLYYMECDERGLTKFLSETMVKDYIDSTIFNAFLEILGICLPKLRLLQNM